MLSLLRKLALTYREPNCIETSSVPDDNGPNNAPPARNVKCKKEMIQLSLSSIGHVIDKELLSDRQSHIYLWDPRYTNRVIECECAKQKQINKDFGSNRTEDTPMIKLIPIDQIGMSH